jgi:hypothetical protein
LYFRTNKQQEVTIRESSIQESTLFYNKTKNQNQNQNKIYQEHSRGCPKTTVESARKKTKTPKKRLQQAIVQSPNQIKADLF